eukprot:c9278_g1_i1.p1 GENE.c9278_g1_i1~~c9278_g1_i1.p1  ORF type:complete len:173 (+),score=21.87 c9278_g1_i1:473-991(+)
MRDDQNIPQQRCQHTRAASKRTNSAVQIQNFHKLTSPLLYGSLILITIMLDESEYVKGAAQSKYANPFRAKEHPDLEERLTRFEAHLLAQNEGHSLLDDAVNEFGGRDVWLGCFCSQDKINKGKCHASIVARLVNQRCNQDTISATNEPTHSTPHAERPSQNVYVPRDRRKK